MVKREIQIGQHTLSIETGGWPSRPMARVVVRMGDTMVLVTACHASSPREGIDFLPLTVDYREYTYASGRIPGGFFKREGKATEKETLTSRMIDRPIRPLFPHGWSFETQVIALRAVGRHRPRLRRAGHHRRLGRAGAVGDAASRRPSPACASAWSTASSSSTRPSRSASRAASISSSPAARTAS